MVLNAMGISIIMKERIREGFPCKMIKSVLITYLLIMNAAAFILMGTDKKKARHNAWRIPEKTLFFTAVLGGSVGSILGMWFFHHKTKHWYFVIGMPLILALQITACYLFCKMTGIQ